MALIDRLFGSKKTGSQPATERVVQVTTPEVDKPRPVRAMVYREVYVTYESGYRRKGVVLDHSENGVRIRFPTNERLPIQVLLHAKVINMEGPASVVWQDGSEVGLKLDR